MQVRALLERLDTIGSRLETITLVVLLTAMMLIAVGQIVMREFFGGGFGWADGLVRLIVLWLALVGSIAACRENRHIRIDALSHILSSRVVAVIRTVVDLFAAAVCGIIALQAWRYLQVEIEYEFTVLGDKPAWVAHVIMPVAFALIAYRFLVLAAKDAREFLFPTVNVATE